MKCFSAVILAMPRLQKCEARGRVLLILRIMLTIGIYQSYKTSVHVLKIVIQQHRSFNARIYFLIGHENHILIAILHQTERLFSGYQCTTFTTSNASLISDQQVDYCMALLCSQTHHMHHVIVKP